APDRNRDHLGPARLEAVEQHLLVRIAGSADKQPRRESGPGNLQRIVHRVVSCKLVNCLFLSFPPMRANAGIQGPKATAVALAPRFREGDDICSTAGHYVGSSFEAWHQPPEKGLTISTSSPAARDLAGHSARRTTAPLMATARNRASGSTPRAASRSASIVT